MHIKEFVQTNSHEVSKFSEGEGGNPERERIGEVFKKIEADCRDDEQLSRLYQELLRYCHRYTDIVCQFDRVLERFNQQLISQEEFNEQFQLLDDTRSIVHDGTIDAFNILSRLMAKKGKDNSWIGPLVNGGRVVYGRYAINKTVLDVNEFNEKIIKQEGVV